MRNPKNSEWFLYEDPHTQAIALNMLRDEVPIYAIARELGIHRRTLFDWRIKDLCAQEIDMKHRARKKFLASWDEAKRMNWAMRPKSIPRRSQVPMYGLRCAALAFDRLWTVAGTLHENFDVVREKLDCSKHALHRLRRQAMHSKNPLIIKRTEMSEVKVREMLAQRIGEHCGKGVYFFQRKLDGAIKIGKGLNVQRRLSHYGTYVEGVCLKVIEGYTKTETQLKHAFASLRIHGEWHRPEPALLQFINALPSYEPQARRPMKQQRLPLRSASPGERYHKDATYRRNTILRAKLAYSLSKAQINDAPVVYLSEAV